MIQKKVYFEKFLAKTQAKNISITFIGLGYVGLPRALIFWKKNIIVYQIDINKEKFNSLNLKKFDSVILITDHDILNYETVKENSKFIVDAMVNIKNQPIHSKLKF